MWSRRRSPAGPEAQGAQSGNGKSIRPEHPGGAMRHDTQHPDRPAFIVAGGGLAPTSARLLPAQALVGEQPEFAAGAAQIASGHDETQAESGRPKQQPEPSGHPHGQGRQPPCAKAKHRQQQAATRRDAGGPPLKAQGSGVGRRTGQGGDPPGWLGPCTTAIGCRLRSRAAAGKDGDRCRRMSPSSGRENAAAAGRARACHAGNASADACARRDR